MGARGILDQHENLGMLIGAFIYREQQLLALYRETLEGFGRDVEGG